MQISYKAEVTLTQSDIEQAIKQYISDNGINIEDKDVVIEGEIPNTLTILIDDVQKDEVIALNQKLDASMNTELKPLHETSVMPNQENGVAVNTIKDPKKSIFDWPLKGLENTHESMNISKPDEALKKRCRDSGQGSLMNNVQSISSRPKSIFSRD